MDKQGKKQMKRYIAWIAAAAVVAGLAVMPLLAAPPREDGPKASILTAEAQHREVSNMLMGGGLLESRDTEDLTIPAEVKLTRYLVGNGDVVEAGDPIAEVDRVSAMTAIYRVQESLDETSADLEAERLKTNPITVNTQVSGTVKKLYAQPGDDITDVILESGALAVIPMDNLMAVTVYCDTPLKAGDTVLVTPGDWEEVRGTVVSNLEGSLKITVKDQGYALDTPVRVTMEDGKFLGEGTLLPNLAWRAYGDSGRVSTLAVREGQKVSAGQTLLRLTDTGHTPEYWNLVSQRQEYEELLEELFAMYRSGTVNAPCSGIVSGVDPEGTFLLEQEEAPGETPGQLSSSSVARRSVLRLSEPSAEDPQTVTITSEGLNAGTVGEAYVSALLGQPEGGTWSSDLNVPGLWLDAATGVIYGTPTAEFHGNVTVVYTHEELASEPKTFALNIDPKPAQYRAVGAIVIKVENGYMEVKRGTVETPVSDPEVKPQGKPDREGLEERDYYVLSVSPNDVKEGDLLWLIFDESGALVKFHIAERTESQIPGLPGGLGGLGGFGGFGDFGGFSGVAGFGGMGMEEAETLYPLDKVTVAVITSQEEMVLPITVDERDVVKLREGQTVELTVDAMGGGRFQAVITEISLTGENMGGRSKFTVTVSVPREKDMYPGMSGSVRIQLEAPREVLTVPVAALVEEGNRVFVYTGYDEENETFLNPVDVTVGISDGEYVEVHGLEKGQTVYYAYYDTLELSYEPESGIFGR